MTACTYCTPGELRTFRVEVCGEILTILTTHGRRARAIAIRRYVRSHDWFASDDPWRTAARNSKVLED